MDDRRSAGDDFLWSGWVVGCAPLLALNIVNLVVGAVTFSLHGNNPFRSVLFGSVTATQLAAVLILGLYVYCLPYSLTVVLRNGLRGLGASMTIVFGILWRLPFAGGGKSTSPSQRFRLNASRRSSATSSGRSSR